MVLLQQGPSTSDLVIKPLISHQVKGIGLKSHYQGTSHYIVGFWQDWACNSTLLARLAPNPKECNFRIDSTKNIVSKTLKVPHLGSYVGGKPNLLEKYHKY